MDILENLTKRMIPGGAGTAAVTLTEASHCSQQDPDFETASVPCRSWYSISPRSSLILSNTVDLADIRCRLQSASSPYTVRCMLTNYFKHNEGPGYLALPLSTAKLHFLSKPQI
eukprot:TRINITY_DN3628_c0_g1_i1.p1 TRINITY_DN3628_c0_g1~~TRINITY_DN3628_c0_g1_i1.p1  ORF type:complete len:114 (-),score=10.41 TRINITY_DN3628_c0_g1_i1:48-389(-)